MNLDVYEWSRNPRGMHAAINYFDLDLLARQRMGWVKIVSLSGGSAQRAAEAMERDITPIVRVYQERPGNAPVAQGYLNQFNIYRSAGVKWFEFYNEPNLSEEWPRGANPDPNRSEIIGPLMDNWLNWAEFIINIGGYPGFPALSNIDGPYIDNTTTWIERMLTYLFDSHFERFRVVLDNGCYIATHPYIYNHFYQEIAGRGPRSARSSSQLNVAESGWHFEYPYDPISQHDDPGRTVWGGTPLAPNGDTVGLLGAGQAIMERLQEMFGVGAVPVVGTEGGIPPPGGPLPTNVDNRFPPYDETGHAHATVAMFEWIATQAPPWLFGVTLWKHDDYFQRPEGPLPVGDLLEQRSPVAKGVPSVAALEDGGASSDTGGVVLEVPGPGPVHGSPDFHFVFLAPELNADWFFDIAEPYWDVFKPTLVPDLEFIEFLPNDRSLAVTAITTPDMIEWLETSVSLRWPNVWLDMLVIDSTDQLAQLLNSRVAAGRRFG